MSDADPKSPRMANVRARFRFEQRCREALNESQGKLLNTGCLAFTHTRSARVLQRAENERVRTLHARDILIERGARCAFMQTKEATA